jgi:hypothetical protein
LDGWAGINCNMNIDDCANNPCKNSATCVDGINDFTCICETGWRGKHCEILISPCDEITCARNSLCLDTRLKNWTKNTYECLCAHSTCKLGSTNRGSTTARTHINIVWVIVAVVLLISLTILFCWYKTITRTKRKNYKPLYMRSLI